MKKGFSTLFIVIILGSVALSIAIFVSTSNFWSVRESFETKDYVRAKVLVDTCAEVALEVIKDNRQYSGSGNQTVDGNNCSYTVTNQGGNNRKVTVTGTVGSITRKLEINTNAFNPLNVVSWQEI